MKLEVVRIEKVIYILYNSGMAISKYKYICKYFKAGLRYMTEISVGARMQIVT